MTRIICRSCLLTAFFLTSAMVSSVAANDAQITDVALHRDGVLLGQVVGHDRQPVKARAVEVHFQGKKVASAITDAKGRFAIRGLRAGAHTIQTITGEGVVQLWAPQTAPPVAQQAALIVEGQDIIVRAQGKGKGHGSWGSNVGLTRVAIFGLGAAGLVWALDNNPAGS